MVLSDLASQYPSLGWFMFLSSLGNPSLFFFSLQNGRVYIADYKILEDIPQYGQDTSERRYVCASLGLFYVKGSGDLVPIAIQLHQNPHSANPIWTPNDAEMDWICAKLWLRTADSQVHQVWIIRQDDYPSRRTICLVRLGSRSR